MGGGTKPTTMAGAMRCRQRRYTKPSNRCNLLLHVAARVRRAFTFGVGYLASFACDRRIQSHAWQEAARNHVVKLNRDQQI